MSDFVAFFPTKEYSQTPKSFETLKEIYRGPLRADEVLTDVRGGASLLLAQSFGHKPIFYAKEDGSGWIVIKGIIFDTRSNTPEPDLSELLNRFLEEDTDCFNHYEGTFALAAWDANKRQGWALNDQTSMLNLYYGEHDDGFYVTTNALSLARALGLILDPLSIQEFLARKDLLVPASMFDGLKRVSTGEHINYRAGKIFHGRHWFGYAPEIPVSRVSDAAETIAEVIMDRFSRYATAANPVVCDLTGGYDSRVIASAADAGKFDFGVTVNGPPELDDVQIANLVAQKMNWPMKYFDTESFWTTEVAPDIRREITYHTSGELPFNEIYHQLFSRPILAQEFKLHMIGGGGEILRYHPWSQEFFSIGRRQLANIDNALNYRYLPEKWPPASLFLQNWIPDFSARFRSHIETICLEQPGTRNTQQLDAAYMWKKTGNPALYLSAAYNWLPTVAPILTAGVLKAAIAMPWKIRLTSQFQRHIIQRLSPAAARITTTYGGPAEPTKLTNLHMEAWQFVNRAKKLTGKLDRMLLKGNISKRLNWALPDAKSEKVPFLTPEFKEFLNLENMYSNGMYNLDGLRQVLRGDDQDWKKRISLILRLATIEELCRELDFKPEADFLVSTRIEAG